MYSTDSNAQWIGECLLKAILMEVCAWPKPGLVTPLSQGAHTDMDIWLFITSSSTIAPCFTLCAIAGENHIGELTELFPVIRKIGIQYENKLLNATQQINTQRGILFSSALLAAVAGWLSAQNQPLTYCALSQNISTLCQNLCRNDFAQLNQRAAKTQGEKLYSEFGITGIRGEAEHGFPLVYNIALPALHQALAHQLSWRESLIHTLLALMACCEDTTVLSRGGQKALREMQSRAQRLVDQGGMLQPDIGKKLTDFNQWCVDNWISPGGCADLLALTLAMYFLCQGDKHLIQENI